MKVGTFVVKGPYLSVCMCLCMLEYMLMKPGTYAYGAGNTCKCSLIYLAGESVRADLLYWVVEGKLRPKPYFLEEVGIQSCGLQISLHEAFESEAFVTLGKGLPAEFIQNISKSSHLHNHIM